MGSQKHKLFDINRICAEIQSLLPGIEWQLDYGLAHISMTCANGKNPRFPLIVTVCQEQGIFVDLSQCGSVLECHTDVAETVKLVQDVLDDKIIVALAYPDEEKFEKQILCSMTQVFCFYNPKEEDNDQLEFAKFLSKVTKPRTFLNRLNVFAFHGVIEISNWSGSTYYKLYRE